MIDTFVLYQTVQKLMPRKEKYADGEKETNMIGSIITCMIGIMISIYAAYLCWKCGTYGKYNLLTKVFTTFFAYCFGIIYLIYYALINKGKCG